MLDTWRDITCKEFRGIAWEISFYRSKQHGPTYQLTETTGMGRTGWATYNEYYKAVSWNFGGRKDIPEKIVWWATSQVLADVGSEVS
jgi:hypothetical protein